MIEVEALVAACRRLAALGLSPGGSGNVSVRVGEQVFLTPTGGALSRVTDADLAVLSLTGEPLSGARPSKEFPLHLAAYHVRPEARAIVHLHSVHAVAVACLDEPMPTVTPYQVTRLGPLPLVPYAPPGSSALAEGVAVALAGHHAALLANHGSVVAAADVDLAADLAEELESAAQLALLLRGLPYRQLPPINAGPATS
ncbi:class II aldolase/adducin family protein [Jiangella alba]|uniref:L-fuculose-phosphate aldolase n=1 Tax=Jiangella alba TaxID=561176 RepID=A0A1H5PN21_9ACTN|nr:class II aldolase/adducin family protein [Jiangella alba]SEF14618.1 L-fuculose-phosphate aldolase [Jiangella alba]